MPNYDKVFSKGIIGKPIHGFPYPQRFCVFCEQEMNLFKVIHVQREEWLFKAIYVCENSNCEAFDEAARKAYVRITYSSEEALTRLEEVPMTFERTTLEETEQEWF